MDCTPRGFSGGWTILLSVALGIVVVACGQPPGGIVAQDSPVVALAQQWVESVQQRDTQLFASTMNPGKLALLAAQDTLAETFAGCGSLELDLDALVTDGTRGRERYIVIGRYATICLQQRNLPATDTFMLQELTIDGRPRVDGWTFGRPPGM